MGAIAWSYVKIPYKMKQGIFKHRSGNLIDGSGNLSSRSGTHPLNPTRIRLLAGTGIAT
jgi:hypothetical protein